MDIMKIFGTNVRKIRKARDLSQEDLAEAIGISVKHLSNIEVGKRFVSAVTLARFCDELKVVPGALFALKTDKYKPESADKTKSFLIDKSAAFAEELLNGLYKLSSEDEKD
jgi:transcriptional regulator with XRE-family HTH domain